MSMDVEGAVVRCAWATLLTSEHLLPGLVVFAHSLLVEHGSRYPLVIMATSTLSARARTIVSTMLPAGRIVVRDVQPIYPTAEATGLAYARFNEVWTKLRAFQLVEWDRIALVDSDMLVRNNMDELFHHPSVFDRNRLQGQKDDDDDDEGEEWIGASWACTCNPNRIPTYPADWTPTNCGFTRQTLPSAASSTDVPQPTCSWPRPSKLINSGLVILTPSTTTMDEMLQIIATNPHIRNYRFPDQDFLADFFSPHPSPNLPSKRKRNIRYLPYIYNALKKLRLVHPNIWSDSHAKNIHYILDKPWSLGRPGSKSNPLHSDPDAHTHTWWWSAFDQLQHANQHHSPSALNISHLDWKECIQNHMTLD